jgi:hypothetical protein
VAADAVSQIHADTSAPRLSAVETHALCDWAGTLLLNLHPWLLGQNHEQIASECCNAARGFQQTRIPLLDVMRGLHILKRTALGFERDLGLDRTAFEIYMEGEFERGLGEYFDFVAWHTVRAYEEQFEPRSDSARA